MGRHSFLSATLLALLLTGGAMAQDSLLWDNYVDDVFLAAWDISSERNTRRAEPTWVVDDVVLDPFVEQGGDDLYYEVTRIEWIGAFDPRYGYDRADFILLGSTSDQKGGIVEPDPASAIEMLDLPVTITPFDPDPDTSSTRDLYTGSITFDTPLFLTPGHFYVGTRLVGAGDGNSGRNGTVVTSISPSVNGITEGYFIGPSFGLPNWTPVSTIFNSSDKFELAYRLYGSVVPEPASLVGLLLGAALLRRRR